MTDDQRLDAVGFMDWFPFLKTPNLDRIAGQGAWFKNAFVTTSLCSPSRACFMTATYAHQNTVRINEKNDPAQNLPLLPEILQQNGYETAFIGKWHMERHAEPRRGFDYWLSFKGQGEYFDPVLNENGRQFQAKGYMTDILTEYANDYISRKRDKPFCLFVWHKAVHQPFKPAPRHKGTFEDVTIKEPASFQDDYKNKPRWQRRGVLYGLHKKDWQKSEGKPVPKTVPLEKWNSKSRKTINYMETILAVDESVGSIYETLRQKGVLDRTSFIFTSDNGYLLGEHQSPIDKRGMWEESMASVGD